MNKAVQTLSDVSRYQDDEIDLFELGANLWRKKATIITVAALITVAAAVMAFMLPKSWESKTQVYQVNAYELAELNSAWGLITSDETANLINPQSTFDSYYRHLTSPKILWQVFEQSGLKQMVLAEPNAGDAQVNSAWDQFQENLSIERSDASSKKQADPVPYISISFTSDDQAFSAKLINEYLIPAARKASVEAFTLNMESDKDRRLEKIDRDIAQIETTYIENNQVKKIARKEALLLAEAGNISELPENLNLSRTLGDKSFLLGTKILKEQLRIQQQQIKNYYFVSRPEVNGADKPMLPAVSSIVFQQKNKLENLDLGGIFWSPVSVDLPAQIPSAPVKPKKSLIVALGMILGGMLGIFVALIQIAIASRKRKLA